MTLSTTLNSSSIIPTDEATAVLPVPGRSPITVIGTDAIRATFDSVCLQQAINSRLAPGVTDVILNPDAHRGYGAPVGSVLVSPTHIYPGPVGVDIKCSMSLLQLNIPADAIVDRATRRALIEAIAQRLPTGAGRGQRSVPKSRPVDRALGINVITQGASESVCAALGIPPAWASRCEDSFHVGHDETPGALSQRLDQLLRANILPNLDEKFRQLGSYGGGNHFGECEIVELLQESSPLSPSSGTPGEGRGEGLSSLATSNSQLATPLSIADTFGLKHNHVAFLSHCGSRGLGHNLAMNQFRALQSHFATWSIPLPGDDRELVYAPLGTEHADNYIDDMALGANFATVNHLLINALVLEAFQEILPGAQGNLVYFISHNIARREIVDNSPAWVHRKGATRAFPAHHHALKETPFYESGHPILLPGNPREGSVVMVATEAAKKTCYSVNHGAGRQMGRKDAMRRLDQSKIDKELDAHDILSNCRQYPMDEAPDAYKDFAEVLRSVEKAGLARPVAKLKARFVLKDGDKADD
jgi:tRNA-splicing ligase RtcB (3'-phosphate/5'-hydroxy nucleic acid ligase)